MNCATESRQTQILVWLIWAIACAVFLLLPERMISSRAIWMDVPALPGVVTYDRGNGPLFPWQPKHRVRKWAWRHYCKLRRAHRRAVWVARFARLALAGALNMAGIVDLLTQAQLRQHLGALPVLYELLNVLQIRQIINRHCPTAAEVDHGTVAMVLTLNRLMAPRPLFRVADWVARTVLVSVLGIPAKKFNDDRLARTLDAISKHTRDIWQDVVHHALIRFDIDLSIIFYDLTAFVVHGVYDESDYVKFGFAHNTPSDKRKVKAAVNASADGNIPAVYEMWPGNTADLATVQQNMDRLCCLLKRRGWPTEDTVIIGDRANLNDELAVAYQDRGLHYLAGLQAHKKVHRQLLEQHPTPQFYAHSLSEGYWGICCPVVFEHAGRQVTHRGLVVLSGPMRTAHRQDAGAFIEAGKLRLQGLPEVEVVGVASRVPQSLNNNGFGIFIDGHQSSGADRPYFMDGARVDEDYLDALALRIESGRGIEPADRDERRRVAVVTRTMASRFWPGEEAVGREFRTSWEGQPYQIVGVVEDYKVDTPGEQPKPYVHFPMERDRTFANYVVKTTIPAGEVVPELERELRELDPDLVFLGTGTLKELADVRLFPIQAGAWLIGAFAMLALVLAAVGLYGVISYSVSQRVREIGIRKALGAQTSRVVGMVLRQGMVLAGLGVALGAALAAIGAQALSGVLFVGAFDPVSFGAAGGVLAGVAVLANWIPARRASLVDPMVAVKLEGGETLR